MDMADSTRRFFAVYFSVFLGVLVCTACALLFLAGQYRPLLPEAPGKDWYLSYYQTDKAFSLDHDRLYYNMGGAIERARDADILILGHSMTVFGFDWRRLERFAEQRDVRIFHLGFLSEISREFSLQLIRRYDLKPKIVIVNLDYQGRPAFLADSMTPYARRVISEGFLKRTLSACLTDKMRWWLGNDHPEAISRVIYRSVRHGGSFVDHWAGYLADHPPFQSRNTDCQAATVQEASQALKWSLELQQRGSEIVLTTVPSRNTCLKATADIAKQIHASFIAVDGRGMTSFDDGYHLDRQGAALFTDRFLQAFESSAAFRRLLAVKEPMR
jgi:hypothetical protein